MIDLVELELIVPPRPVRRPEEFYQVFLGGVDTDYIATPLNGYMGCLRGLSIGGQIIDLTTKGVRGHTKGTSNPSIPVHSRYFQTKQKRKPVLIRFLTQASTYSPQKRL